MSAVTKGVPRLALKDVLSQGRTAFATFNVFGGSRVAQVLAHTGVDAVIVDREHGHVDDSQMHDMVPTVASSGVSPIVRIAGFKGSEIKRALDTGAHGIIAPMVSTAEDARLVVRQSKFPPVGTRGQGSPFACFSYGFATPAEYVAHANEQILVMAQIETSEAVDNVYEICQVDGLDLLLIGPNDLSLAILGYAPPKGNEEIYYSSIDKVVATAKKYGKYVGMVVVDGASAKAASENFDLVVLTADGRALQAWYRKEVAIARS
ncbi:hypothetical protein M409DRAFT_24294 [Zasmidium cellare ATCC 36951]|uniref:HpcH/HpaI aldolase/citrate lyase domain-containing protein n=1 Tax=Zasmidium cellare ATCC 36951 TaxID=1080233 RepID=A0A6A6CEB7_ZASCE|nr:uncharacterized protein M409DRAFT_24294 [Zasmidium cellare ATCC 36951]KAF2165445.1 hypothetical protein M409DRAFT_24294 [Zasmidium cellare ATCC 36951]